MNKKEIKSDANDILTNEYYKFLVIKDNKIIDTIICGDYVAKDFCKLLHIKPLSIFNIFQTDINNIINKSNIETDILNSKKWNKENKLLYIAFKILTLYYTISPNTIIYKIIDNIENNKENFNIKNLKSFNTIIKNFNIILKQLLLKIEKENNSKLKNYDFQILKNIFINAYSTEKQNFD